jgi:hypothetical protein
VPDTILTLKSVLKKVETALVDAKTVQAGIAEPEPAETRIVSFTIRLVSDLELQGQCRLRLWDAYGRNPQIIDRSGTVGGEAKDWDLPEKLEPIPVEQAPDSLHNSTLTWSIRLRPKQLDSGERYALQVQVLQEERVLPGGNFSYSGPLDDYEEVAGRFHFAVTP